MLYIFRFLHQTTTAGTFLLQMHSLYIFRFLHQTTTQATKRKSNKWLYIFRFLHQTTTVCRAASSFSLLYIFRFLHQTTTALIFPFLSCCCISFVFYIKPQLCLYAYHQLQVVYLSFSTSNHNSSYIRLEFRKLYIFRFLHQTTTAFNATSTFDWLYIFRFLHQTTTSHTFSIYFVMLYIFRFLHQTTTYMY